MVFYQTPTWGFNAKSTKSRTYTTPEPSGHHGSFHTSCRISNETRVCSTCVDTNSLHWSRSITWLGAHERRFDSVYRWYRERTTGHSRSPIASPEVRNLSWKIQGLLDYTNPHVILLYRLQQLYHWSSSNDQSKDTLQQSRQELLRCFHEKPSEFDIRKLVEAMNELWSKTITENLV